MLLTTLFMLPRHQLLIRACVAAVECAPALLRSALGVAQLLQAQLVLAKLVFGRILQLRLRGASI